MNTWRNTALPKHIRGSRPHAAKAMIQTAGINLSTRVVPQRAS